MSSFYVKFPKVELWGENLRVGKSRAKDPKSQMEGSFSDNISI